MDAAGDGGSRVAQLRKARALTQVALARRAEVSVSLLSKIEVGDRALTPDTAAAIARALRMSLRALYGEAEVSEEQGVLLAELMPPIRVALDMTDLAADDSIRPRPVRELSAAVRQVNRLAQAARYEPMSMVLPDLLAELYTATQTCTGHERETAWGLLAEACRCGHSVGIAIGMNELSVTALQRMDWAASHAGARAPALRAVREYLRVTAYLRARDFDACWRLNASGMAKLEGADSNTPDALVARGQLHLGASIIAAHTGDLDTMREHLAEAERIAASTGERTERLWVGFGPTNVAVHRSMGLATAGEHGRAVEVGEGLRFPAEWLPTRIGHHHLDMARAWRWLAKPDKALKALMAAREVAPGQARRHPLTRDSVEALMRSARRPSAALSEYATWIGL